ncbi:MAG: hypothetical protein HQK81_14175 [Desulfovibrionaceae bacterium]|nr:hypothetical protein [Desulfovibrionaceae bacterium]MBF0515190.1 hypothetical protein [Desulfovibrionaceae bacterium]
MHSPEPRRKPPVRDAHGLRPPAGLCAALFAAQLPDQPSDGPGLIEILIVAGLIVLAVRFFQSRPGKPGERDRRDAPGDQPPQRRFTLSDDPWDRLRSKPKQQDQPESPEQSAASRPESGAPDPVRTALPGEAATAAGQEPVDDEFLRGAKMFYSRITASLAEGDFDDLAEFCAPPVLQRLRSAPRESVEIIRLTASLVEQKQTGERIAATVAYRSLERRGYDPKPRERQAAWVFGKPAGDPAATWLLDAIIE